jgi:Reverse transcriptase (RNA-dependent DNA polymerase)
MQHVYSHRFRTSKGLEIYVPTPMGRKLGETVADHILTAWTPHSHFYHFRSGGHVEAARLHTANPVFARLDIQSFFDSVTRSKVYRALRWLRIPKADALDYATLSTVAKASGRSLPFGFVQSPAVASLVLDRSALGKAFRSLRRAGEVALSVYMDDILVSGSSVAQVEAAADELDSAAGMSGFDLSPAKRQVGVPEIEAFNLRLAQEFLEVTPERMEAFAAIERTTNGARERAIVRYVAKVNEAQSLVLEKVFGLKGSPEASSSTA